MIISKIIIGYYSSWFKYTKQIRCWSKNNSTNGIRWTIKKIDTDDYATDAGDNDQFRFVLTVLEKIQEARLKFSLGSATVL